MKSEEKIDSAIDRLLYLKGLALTTKTTVACAHIDAAYEEVLAALHSVEAEKEPKWISCEQMLPTDEDHHEDELYIGWDKYNDHIVICSEGEVLSNIYISHWMATGLRRPAPPEKE